MHEVVDRQQYLHSSSPTFDQPRAELAYSLVAEEQDRM